MKNDLTAIHVPPIIDIPANLVDPKELLAGAQGDRGTNTKVEEQMLNYVRG